MASWVMRMIHSAGSPGIALLMFIENVFPPIPSELIMPLAGYMVTRDQLSMAAILIAGTPGPAPGAPPPTRAGPAPRRVHGRPRSALHGRDPHRRHARLGPRRPATLLPRPEGRSEADEEAGRAPRPLGDRLPRGDRVGPGLVRPPRWHGRPLLPPHPGSPLPDLHPGRHRQDEPRRVPGLHDRRLRHLDRPARLAGLCPGLQFREGRRIPGSRLLDRAGGAARDVRLARGPAQGGGERTASARLSLWPEPDRLCSLRHGRVEPRRPAARPLDRDPRAAAARRVAAGGRPGAGPGPGGGPGA